MAYGDVCVRRPFPHLPMPEPWTALQIFVVFGVGPILAIIVIGGVIIYCSSTSGPALDKFPYAPVFRDSSFESQVPSEQQPLTSTSPAASSDPAPPDSPDSSTDAPQSPAPLVEPVDHTGTESARASPGFADVRPDSAEASPEPADASPESASATEDG